MVPDVDLFVVEEHAIHGFDGGIGSLSGLIMNKTVSFGATDFISRDLARQNVAESRKCIVKSLIENLTQGNHYMMTSFHTLLSICSSRFLIKMLPWPVLRRAGSRWDHMIRLQRGLSDCT
jgi:hypothetical protein